MQIGNGFSIKHCDAILALTLPKVKASRSIVSRRGMLQDALVFRSIPIGDPIPELINNLRASLCARNWDHCCMWTPGIINFVIQTFYVFLTLTTTSEGENDLD